MGQSYVFFSDTVKGDAGRPRVEPAHFQGRTRRFEKGRAAKALSAPSIGTPLIKHQSPVRPPALQRSRLYTEGRQPQKVPGFPLGGIPSPAPNHKRHLRWRSGFYLSHCFSYFISEGRACSASFLGWREASLPPSCRPLPHGPTYTRRLSPLPS